MNESSKTSDTSVLTEFNRPSLFEACSREAKRLGGDERCAEYFFVRAQSSRVWFSSQGDVIVADMAIEDWCAAIAWSAPGLGRPPKRANKNNGHIDDEPRRENTFAEQPGRKQPRSGAHFRRPSGNAA